MRKKEKKYIASDRKLLKSISTTTKESNEEAIFLEV